MKSLFIALSGLLVFTACSKPQAVPQAPQKIELVLPPDSRTVVDTKVIQKKEEVKPSPFLKWSDRLKVIP